MNDIKVFRILYSGEIKEESLKGEIVELFSNLNILSFYIHKNKRLYTWIGSDASRTLKNYISNMRQSFSEEYPYLRVLRYFTEDSLESMNELNDFFSDIGISKQAIINHLKAEKSKYEEQYFTELNTLKEQADIYFEKNEFNEAIKVSKEIIQLAIESKDGELLKDQKAFIAEAEARLKAQHILDQIREERKLIKEMYYEATINEKNIEKTYGYVQEFKHKYEEYLKLSALETVRKLILDVEELWNSYNYKKTIQEERKKYLEVIIDLRNKAKKSLEQFAIIDACNYFHEITSKLNQILKIHDEER
ncbi:MAG: hypothetical protein BAJALOKI1v1_290010 [Promethearchaeota archaeon]|nr:MAG: hypothetical protein BAJALOKI1v1_290010 [Candidatus Lokiarchaeota archaeon]